MANGFAPVVPAPCPPTPPGAPNKRRRRKASLHAAAAAASSSSRQLEELRQPSLPASLLGRTPRFRDGPDRVAAPDPACLLLYSSFRQAATCSLSRPAHSAASSQQLTLSQGRFYCPQVSEPARDTGLVPKEGLDKVWCLLIFLLPAPPPAPAPPSLFALSSIPPPPCALPCPSRQTTQPGPGAYETQSSLLSAARVATVRCDVFDPCRYAGRPPPPTSVHPPPPLFLSHALPRQNRVHRGQHVTSCKGTLPLTARGRHHALPTTCGRVGPGAYDPVPLLQLKRGFSRDDSSGFGGAKLDRSQWVRTAAGSTPCGVPHQYGPFRDAWNKPTYNRALAQATQKAVRCRAKPL